MMSQLTRIASVLNLCAAITIFAGCRQEQSSDESPQSESSSSERVHDHPDHGPHGGSLIEFGTEQYHAEFLPDEDTGSVTVHILDSKAKTSVPIEAQKALINVSYEDQGLQFTLSASPVEGDPVGKASCFVSDEVDLAKHIQHDHAEATLVVSILGKQYRGTIKHEGNPDHDHDHEHEHE